MGFAPMAFAFLEQKTTWAQVPKVEKIKTAEIRPSTHGQKSKRNQLFCQVKSYKNLVGPPCLFPVDNIHNPATGGCRFCVHGRGSIILNSERT
jgi:hypothetical protein